MPFTNFQKHSARIAFAGLFAVGVALLNSLALAQCADGSCGINMSAPAANSYQSISYGNYTSYGPVQSYSGPASYGYHVAPMHDSYGYQPAIYDPAIYDIVSSYQAPVCSTGYAPSYTSYYTPSEQPIYTGYQPVLYPPVSDDCSPNYRGSYGGGCNGSSCGVY